MSKDILIAGTASFLNGLILAPLDMVTTRSKSVHTSSTSFTLMSQICKNEGIKGLWKGSSWYIFAQMVSRGIWLSSYNIILDKSDKDKSSIIFASGTAGLLTSTLSNSIWNIKTHAQLPNYTGLRSVIFKDARICTHSNIEAHVQQTNYIKFNNINTRIFTYGLYSSCLLVTIESIAHLFTYEMLKEWVKLNSLMIKDKLDLEEQTKLDSPIINGMLGGIGRVSILPLTYPLHVINLRYREQTKSVSKPLLSDIWTGICKQRAWYAGMSVYTCRVAPQSILLFYIYESCKKYL